MIRSKKIHSIGFWNRIHPGVRYLALRDLMDIPVDDPELRSAQMEAHRNGPIATILDNMLPEGYWVKKGPGYNPKYRSIVWSLTLLAQLGASVDLDERIRLACNYLLKNNLHINGAFFLVMALPGEPLIACRETFPGHCSCWDAMTRDWRRLLNGWPGAATGEGIAPASDRDAEVRYYAYKCGPNFACGANNKNGCAWGAVKVMLALSRLPVEKRTPIIDRAIQAGVDFLFSTDPAVARYPARTGNKPSRDWWKFGFPIFYVTDLLQNVEALAGVGYGSDPRLANAINFIQSQQDENGRWSLEYDYNEKTWVNFGEPKQPNKWVTLRALRVLKACGANA